MRTTTYLGLILGVGIVVFAIHAKGSDLTIFSNYVALLVCLGGTIAATTVSSSRQTIVHVASAMRKLLFAPMMSSQRVADQMVQLARSARSGGGAAAIDPEAVNLDDPFLQKGLRLVADGVESGRIEMLMRLESDILSEQRRSAERMFRLMGTYSPMFGLIGTLIGLISMLKGLTDPRAVGHGMSVALMATFYGVLLAGLVFLPLAGKIRTLDADERLVRDQILAGLLALRAGENPEAVREMLDIFARRTAAA